MRSNGRAINWNVFFAELAKTPKNTFFQKIKGSAQGCVKNIFTTIPPGYGAYDVYTFQWPNPLDSMAIRKKHDFGTFPDLWRHRQITLFFRICDLAYRSNETFFSRTLRFSISRPAWPLRVRSINDKNDDENAAHVRNGMVLWRSPETVVSRTASRVATTIVAEIVLFLFLTISFFKIFSIVISPSYWTLHQQ